LADLAAFETNPFSTPPETDKSLEHRPVADVSVDAMSRLRTPFGVDGDSDDRDAGEPVRQP
jgi:hypothetical protein